MHVDVIDLRGFYAGALGLRTRTHLRAALEPHMAGFSGLDVAAIGFGNPYLRPYLGEAERIISLMPAAQGCMTWPSDAPNAAALVEDHALPIKTSALDRVLLVHALEFSPHPRVLMNEVWRILAPGGRMIAVVPNRSGLLARFDTTPFGHGRPYSKEQMMRLCREALFSPEAVSEALHFFPFENAIMRRISGFLERIGRWRMAPPGGVIIIEATKQLYQGVPAGNPAVERTARPVLVPAGAAPFRR